MFLTKRLADFYCLKCSRQI